MYVNSGVLKRVSGLSVMYSINVCVEVWIDTAHYVYLCYVNL